MGWWYFHTTINCGDNTKYVKIIVNSHPARVHGQDAHPDRSGLRFGSDAVALHFSIDGGGVNP